MEAEAGLGIRFPIGALGKTLLNRCRVDGKPAPTTADFRQGARWRKHDAAGVMETEFYLPHAFPT
jgi:hypothetical protein